MDKDAQPTLKQANARGGNLVQKTLIQAMLSPASKADARNKRQICMTNKEYSFFDIITISITI